MKTVRTRFAPSPTGGLHLGGVRTALFSFLYAKKHQGQFIIRIEDTDQNRYVPGAEQYILDALQWCGIVADESPVNEGEYGPYRQSERKEIYKQYAIQLVESGYAYYAFDTTEELEKMRLERKTAQNPSPQYDRHTRMHMRNSLTYTSAQTQALLDNKTPYVIRIKVPENKIISFDDMIRGNIQNDSNLLDDKVLLKADGMPTYHLAVVVDDYLMKITHAFRGEEWLPSAPVHILLWQYLGWEKDMPQWAHLPLILKPDGNGKLSKRDGERLGFPVFPLDWHDTIKNEHVRGFREKGFLPQAFVNMLALLGWNSGSTEEVFDMDFLIQHFSIEKVHSHGAKFDYEKAKWFNHEWIKKANANFLLPFVKSVLLNADIETTDTQKLESLIDAVKERCVLLNDFAIQLSYFYKTPSYDAIHEIQAKWNEQKTNYFEALISDYEKNEDWDASILEQHFKTRCESMQLKTGEVMLPFRMMLVGGKFGPGVFFIAHMLGKAETINRCKQVLTMMKS